VILGDLKNILSADIIKGLSTLIWVNIIIINIKRSYGMLVITKLGFYNSSEIRGPLKYLIS